MTAKKKRKTVNLGDWDTYRMVHLTANRLDRPAADIGRWLLKVGTLPADLPNDDKWEIPTITRPAKDRFLIHPMISDAEATTVDKAIADGGRRISNITDLVNDRLDGLEASDIWKQLTAEMKVIEADTSEYLTPAGDCPDDETPIEESNSESNA